MSGRLRCWPGALAVIRGTRSHPQMNGVVVECIKSIPGGFWLVRGHTLGAYAKSIGFRPEVRDDKLTPILPPPSAESTTTDAAQPVEAA